MNTHDYQNIPGEMRDLDHWLVWKLITKPGQNKASKVPYCVNGGAGKTNDPTTWSSYADAVKAYESGKYNGIGFVFTDTDYIAVDIDHCYSSVIKEFSPVAQDILTRLASYTELSQSGEGLHIIVKGALPTGNRKNEHTGVEMYGHGSPRYFAMTGAQFNDTLPVREDCQSDIDYVHSTYVAIQTPESSSKKLSAAKSTHSLTDEEIIAKAQIAENADVFTKLWSGDTSAYNGDDSAADLALCSILAFWSGKNANLIDRLFRKSGLMRLKWDEKRGREPYGVITIQKAIDSCVHTYEPNSSFYIVENGNTYRKTGQNEKKYLANFSAFPLEEMEKDDGVHDKATYFVIGGRGANNVSLTPVAVSSEIFPTMNWIGKNWGMFYRIAPGNSNKDYFRDYIQSQAENIRRRTVYTHTGFREINGELCFLHHGGALGADNVQCELEGDLHRYTFTSTQGITERDALTEVMQLFKLAPPEVSYALLAFTYLAPLNYFLEQEGVAPSFSLFNIGETGSFKTVMSMLYLAHFRSYIGMSETPPTNFHSTSNAIEKMSFDLKDVPLLIDDYHPTNASDKKRMDGIAQRLARGAGDHISRSRLNSDTSLKASYSPRGLSIVTGEDMPDIGQSGLARYYFVKFNKGLIDTDDLTQRQANATLLNAAMQGYIKWLMANSDDVEQQIKARYLQQLREVHIVGSHSRTAPIISWLQTAVYYFVEYAVEVGVMTESEGLRFFTDAWAVFIKSGEEQARTQAEETPIHKFLSVLGELLASGKKTVENLNKPIDENQSVDRRIGYCDDQYYFLFPDATYNAVSEVLRGSGSDFPVSKPRLLSDLERAGLVYTQGGRTTIKKRIYDTNTRYIALVKSALAELKENDDND